MKLATFFFYKFGYLRTLCLIFALGSCGENTEAIVQEKVDERVAAFRKKKTKECRERLLQTAEKTVDSLLLTDAQNALNDSLTRLRPWRPVQPAVILPIDSLTVKPIFDRMPSDTPNGQ